MKLTINRESAVPLHDQLVRQVALQIAAGVLTPGQRLLSIRALAGRLDIHPNTVSAVYKALEVYGLVTVRQGSGVRVIEQRAPGEPGQAPSLTTLAESFVAAAKLSGSAPAAITQAVARALDPEPINRLVVIDPYPDFHALYLHELGRWLTCPITVLTPDDLATAPPEWLVGAAIATSMFHLAVTETVVGPERPIAVFRVSTGEELLDVVRGMPKGQTLALISGSQTMLNMANDLVAALRGQELLLLECGLDDEERLRSVIRLADVVATDGPCAASVRGLTHKPMLTLELLPRDALLALASHLPSEALRRQS